MNPKELKVGDTVDIEITQEDIDKGIAFAHKEDKTGICNNCPIAYAIKRTFSSSEAWQGYSKQGFFINGFVRYDYETDEDFAIFFDFGIFLCPELIKPTILKLTITSIS